MQELCRRVYPFSKPWSLAQLESHRSYFPDGQWIVLDETNGEIVGMALSLIVVWDDYSSQDDWGYFTSGGFFHNHNPKKGRTLYGAEVIVDPERRGQGIGKLLYQGRKQIVEKYGLKRIRAGARLRGYSQYEGKLSPDEYVKRVIQKKLSDPTLSFQLSQGFTVIDVAPNYLFNDPESMGYAAVIEWLNPKAVTPRDLEKQRQRVDAFMAGDRFVPEHLPKELRRLVRKATLTLGQVIREQEGDAFYRRVEHYREQLKKVRNTQDKAHLLKLMGEVARENREDRFKLAHAFSLQLEIVNACEASYRTWRLRQKSVPQGVKSKLNLTYVLTAHPTEARSRATVEILDRIEALLIDGIQNGFLFDESELSTRMRLIWLYPFTKSKAPTVLDEAEYIYSMIFSKEMFGFLLSEKPSYDLKLRTWVGGDKDGHPHVNKDVMRSCLGLSRKYVLEGMRRMADLLLKDLHQLDSVQGNRKNEIEGLKKLLAGLKVLETIGPGDGTRVKAWTMKYRSYLKTVGPFVRKHHQVRQVNRVLELFPAFVLPIELREDSGLLEKGIRDSHSAIRGMLSELARIAGALDLTSYAAGLVVSHCETAEDLTHACTLVFQSTKRRSLPVIPLFETQASLSNVKKILHTWLSEKRNLDLATRHWGGKFEVMLGYSDSAKQMGVLPSRYLVARAMTEAESRIKRFGLKPIFFHGSGGSVARGGGSLKEQIAWWSNSAVERPKLTIQGEMIQRKFATREILNSQCIHMANEALRRKVRKVGMGQSSELDRFVRIVEGEYSALVSNGPLLSRLLDVTPYRYLEVLKIGSRPSSRPGSGLVSAEVSLKALRAIPWVLSWTQSRLLLPTWWGVGTAWKKMSPEERKKIQALYPDNAFLSSFVKTLGFTLAKVELDIWEMYFHAHPDRELFMQVRREYQDAVRFVQDISQEKKLIWYRPWLEESIRLRSPQIHILNILQILAMESDDETLLRETLVGIACGMLTTG